MEKITSVAELRQTILKVEAEQALKGQILKEQVNLTIEVLRPASLLKRVIETLGSNPSLANEFLGTSVGLASGFLSRKLVVGKSRNLFRNILGTLIQYGVTSFIARNSEVVKAIGQHIIHSMFVSKEEDNPES
jgi:hypothetical protein